VGNKTELASYGRTPRTQLRPAKYMQLMLEGHQDEKVSGKCIYGGLVRMLLSTTTSVVAVHYSHPVGEIQGS